MYKPLVSVGTSCVPNDLTPTGENQRPNLLTKSHCTTCVHKSSIEERGDKYEQKCKWGSHAHGANMVGVFAHLQLNLRCRMVGVQKICAWRYGDGAALHMPYSHTMRPYSHTMRRGMLCGSTSAILQSTPCAWKAALMQWCGASGGGILGR